MQGGQAVPLFITTELKHINSYSTLSSIPYCEGDGKCHPIQHIQLYIGATMSAKQAGISNIHIQIYILERQKSQAFLQYIRIPRSQLAMLSKQLVQGHTVQQLN